MKVDISAMSDDNTLAFRRYQSIRGLSPNTIQRRAVAIGLFAVSIAPLPLLETTGELIDDWLGTYLSASTRRAYRSDLMAFFSWATKRDICATNPVLRTDSIKVPKPLPRPVPAQYLPAILAAATPDIRLMVGLAAYAGLRVAEIAALDAADVDLVSQPPTLTVRCGKGSRDRAVPLHPHLVELLREHHVRSGRLINVTAATVGDKVAAHLRRLGIPATAHKLRASFATELARASNGNVIMIAALMGHGDISTSMRYVAFANGPGASVVAAMYPAA